MVAIVERMRAGLGNARSSLCWSAHYHNEHLYKWLLMLGLWSAPVKWVSSGCVREPGQRIRPVWPIIQAWHRCAAR